MKRLFAVLLVLALALTAVSALAETKVNFFTGKIETIDLLNEIIDRNGYANIKLFYEKFKEKYGLTPGQVRKFHDADQQQN